jgi:flagellar biosynthesis repressor protein FlbT
MKIHLKKGEKLYVNGAVLKVEQRCSIELLNNVTFLLEAHVMQSEMATTPFEQLYFVIQTILIDPENEALTRQMYWHLSDSLHVVLENSDLISGLKIVDEYIKSQRFFDALKIVRGLFPVEKTVIQADYQCGEKIALQRAVA